MEEMTTTPPQSSQHEVDRAARRAALAALGTPPGADAPALGYRSAGRTVILGREDRIRRLADALAGRVPLCGVVTQALPGQITPDIEAAAELAQDTTLLQLPLGSIDGYLGHFDLQIEVGGEIAPLARLAFGSEYCDVLVDLNDSPRLQRELPPPGFLHAEPDAAPEALAAEVLALVGEFERPRFTIIDNALCAHSASGITGCTRCLDACPADAIRSADGRIVIDAHLCQGAGGCASLCPTGAIRYDHPAPAIMQARLERLLAAYAEAGGRTPRLLLHDAAAGAGWIEANLETLDGAWLPLQLEEIGAAGLDLWLQALARGAGEVLLLASAAPDSIRRDLDGELAVAQQILAALATGHRITLLDEPERLPSLPPPTPRPMPALTGHSLDYDKRALISAATAHLYRNSGLPVAGQLVELPAGAPFGALEIELAGCTLCAACVSACPVKALGSGRDRPLLSFVEERCVQCGLCVQSCPEKVLQLAPRYQLDPETRSRPLTLKEEPPFECIRCGKPFATQSMIRNMQARLAGHRMFAGAAAERLKMCPDCRVIDMAGSEQDAGLVGLAQPVVARRPEGNRH